MRVLRSITVTESVLVSSSLTEADYAVWASGTSYAIGDRVIVQQTSLPKVPSEVWALGDPIYWSTTLSKATTTVMANAFVGYAAAGAGSGTTTALVAVHAIYESVIAANAGNNPVSDTGAKWVKVGATNLWSPFDRQISRQASGTSPLWWTFTLPSAVTGVALFGLEAQSVTVTIQNADAVVTYTETRQTVDDTGVDDWAEYFAWDGSGAREMIFTDLPGYTGSTMQVSVSGAPPAVGQIVLGRISTLGTAGVGTEIGFEDYSRKDRDDFGNPILIERDYSDLATFTFFIPFGDRPRVQRLITDLRAKPSVWFIKTGEGTSMVYGFPSGGFRVPLAIAGGHIASLEIEGLT